MERNALSPEEKRRLQTEELAILDELDRICSLHGLRYYLTAGTLLGAVRHGGFIPWDDDIDVAMPRDDYERLAELSKTELSDGFFYQSEKTEKNYPFFFAKIRKDGTEVNEPILEGVELHRGCYLDIFPLDKCPKSRFGARLFFKSVELFSCAIMSKISREFVCEYKKPLVKFGFNLVRLLPLSVLRALRRFTRAFYAIFSSGEVLCTVSGSHGYPRESYKAEWFDKSLPLSFEGKEYPAPSEWDKLLESMYGDYMTPPDEDSREGHFKS